MGKIKILLDSGSDISKEDCQKYDIAVVPLTIQTKDASILDYYDFDADAYCQYLRDEPVIPSTSQPSPSVFIDYFNKYTDEYEAILCITMSPGGSGTYNSACIARDMFHEKQSKTKIYIVDSKHTSMCMIMLAKIAAGMIEKGENIHDIIKTIEEKRMKLSTYYLVDNIDFLIKGGRVSSITGGIISKLNIKPIITIKDGVGHTHSTTLGYARGIAKLAQLFVKQAHDLSELYISHSNCIDKVNAFISNLKESVDDVKIYVYQMGGTMSTHAGPDTVGIFFS